MTDKPKRTSKVNPSMIKDVYAHNFKEEILNISNLIEEFPFIGMDTEFPGIVFSKENQQLRTFSNYQLTKLNVDSLKVIQVGITLCDKNSMYPEETCTWQFNLRFEINVDHYQKSSINLLTSSGIDFDALQSNGIPHLEFGEYLIISGLILNPDIYWVTFHGIYDFAYLLKVITNTKLPELEKEFYDHLDLYFCNYFDLRHIIQFTDYSKGSLQKLASETNIQRIGNQHQAGSDSVVTLMAFMKIAADFITTPITNYKNFLFHYVEKDDVEFDINNNKNNMYFNHFNNFRSNMMYMYPYYNNMGMSGIGNNMGLSSTSNNMMNMNMTNIFYDDKINFDGSNK